MGGGRKNFLHMLKRWLENRDLGIDRRGGVSTAGVPFELNTHCDALVFTVRDLQQHETRNSKGNCSWYVSPRLLKTQRRAAYRISIGQAQSITVTSLPGYSIVSTQVLGVPSSRHCNSTTRAIIIEPHIYYIRFTHTQTKMSIHIEWVTRVEVLRLELMSSVSNLYLRGTSSGTRATPMTTARKSSRTVAYYQRVCGPQSSFIEPT